MLGVSFAFCGPVKNKHRKGHADLPSIFVASYDGNPPNFLAKVMQAKFYIAKQDPVS